MTFLAKFRSKFHSVSSNNKVICNDFHLCTKNLLYICMFFGLFPLQGVRKSNPSHLKFKWKSIKVFHSVLIMTSGLLISVSAVVDIIKRPRIQALNCLAFFFRGFLTGYVFLRLAQKWPNFIRKMHSVEFLLRKYPPCKNIRKQLKIINGGVLALALVEHFLVQLDLFIKSVLERDGDILLGFQRFFVHYSYGYIFDLIPYTLFGGIWIQYINVNLTFSWTFLDMFICSTSMIIASKIYQISRRVDKFIRMEESSEDQWRIVREDFSRVYKIFKEYNRVFNSLIVLSFTVNVYFLLVQLFGAMKFPFTPSSFLYYLISFGLLLIRLTSVCIGGAQINERSRELTDLLVTIPSFLYNEEIKRFVVHLKFSPAILSVDDFFYAYKGTLLKVVGALIAYEVILIQFDKELLKS